MFRRGKLTFLSTKDDRIRVIHDRINLTEKHLIEMCGTFASCTRKMAKHRNAYDELAKGLQNYADEEEINESLSGGLKSFTDAITILGDYMDVHVKRTEMKIVNELAQFENLCRSTRDSLRTAVIARDKEVLKQRQIFELKAKFASNNSAADPELMKAKLEVNRTNKEIDEIISNFEKRKLSDLKGVLVNFILISLKYHTKALEALTASYYDVSNIDEHSDFVEFQKLMKTKDETAVRKSKLKKGLRSQSMESLERGENALSPIKKHGRLSKSTKNIAHQTDEDDDDDDEEDDDDEVDEQNDSNTSAVDENSGTMSENDASETDSELKRFKPAKRIKSQAQIKQPFKTVAATHIKSKSENQFQIQSMASKLRIGNTEGMAGKSFALTKQSQSRLLAGGISGKDAGIHSRIVKVAESKQKKTDRRDLLD